MSSGRRTVAAAATWLAVLACTFMLFTGQWTAVDWVGAGACALVAATVTVPMMRMGLFDVRFRIGWLRHIPPALTQVLPDFWRVTSFLARSLAMGERGSGRFVGRRDFPTGGTDAEGTAWRAFVAITSTVSPNSYVVDVDPRTATRLSHDLTPNRRSESPA